MHLEPGIEAHERIYIDTPEQAGGSGSSAAGGKCVCRQVASRGVDGLRRALL